MSLKKLASETAIYGGSTILVRLINYALTPLHTGVFAPGGYGIIAEFYAYAAIFLVIYTYGMETAFFRFAIKEPEKQNDYFSNILSSLLLTSSFFSGLLIFFSSPLANALGYPEGQSYIVWFALIFALDAVMAIPFARLRLQRKPVRFAAIKILNVLIVFLLNFFFLVVCPGILEGKYLPGLAGLVKQFYNPELGLGYAFLSNLLANATLPLFFAKSLLQLNFRLNFSLMKPLYQYGYPIIFTGLAASVNEVADRIFLRFHLPDQFYPGLSSIEAVGIYAACYKLSIFITLAVQAFKYAAEPFFFARSVEKNAALTYSNVMKFFVLTCLLMYLGVCANVGWLSRIFIVREVYLQGLHVVPILLMANIFLGIYYNLAVWYKITDRTHYGAWISLGGAAITLLLNFLLIPLFGYTGSAYATLCCYAAMCIACYFTGAHFYPVPYPVLQSLGWMALATGLSAGMVLRPAQWEGYLWNNALVAVFAVMVYFLVLRKLNLTASKT
jgi:O-antigen/teichoic acid export membrane protein